MTDFDVMSSESGVSGVRPKLYSATQGAIGNFDQPLTCRAVPSVWPIHFLLRHLIAKHNHTSWQPNDLLSLSLRPPS